MSKALVISNQYQQFSNARLYGCYNDADNFISRLKLIDPKITIISMRDDLEPTNSLYPTRANILREFENLCKSTETKLYFYFSGHGTYIPDFNNDEKTINSTNAGRIITQQQSLLQDSCMVSNDIVNLNIIVDDELAKLLQLLSNRQTLYGFMDSCHSGTGFDLCYVNMGSYNGFFSSKIIPELRNEITRKCSILSSNYPDKINKVKGNVILISGTRDNTYSYEGYTDGKPSGYFTNALCWLLDYGVSGMTMRQFYYYLMAIINNRLQIPVITTSQRINFDLVRMNDFVYSSKSKPITKVQPVVPKFVVYKQDE